MAIYGELGRYPMFINRYKLIIKVWCTIIYSDHIIIKKLYKGMLLSANDNWAKQVKLLLDTLLIKTLVILLDNFKQTWWQNICNSGTVCTYKYLKSSLSIEAYLDILPKKLRKCMSQ